MSSLTCYLVVYSNRPFFNVFVTVLVLEHHSLTIRGLPFSATAKDEKRSHPRTGTPEMMGQISG